MNEVYAIDPTAPQDWRELKLLLDKFGLRMGRFIAEYPMEWRELLQKNFANASDMDRARVIELLRRAGDACLATDLDFKRAMGWKENAIRLQESKKPFHGVISGEDQPPIVEALQTVLFDSNRDLVDGRGAHIARTSRDYVRAAEPLLNKSAEVYLLDRYFRLRVNGHRDSRHAEVLRSFLAAAQKSQKCRHLVLVVDRSIALEGQQEEDRWECDLEEVLETSRATDVDISYRFHPPLDHGRYLLSIRGGLQFDHGFDIDSRDPNKRNHVHWLSESELEPLIAKYIEHRA